jgi:hypothetical protein
VHGHYPEAQVGNKADFKVCAPSFDIFGRWADLPILDPTNVVLESASEEKPIREKPVTASATGKKSEKAEGAEKASGEDKSHVSAGAQVLKRYMENCPPWSEIQETYRSSDAAKWADVGLYTQSGSGQRKLKQRWNKEYTEKILRMLAGPHGAPVQSVIKRAWDSDNDPQKVLANYFVRRLTSGDSKVTETEDGMLIAETE